MPPFQGRRVRVKKATLYQTRKNVYTLRSLMRGGALWTPRRREVPPAQSRHRKEELLESRRARSRRTRWWRAASRAKAQYTVARTSKPPTSISATCRNRVSPLTARSSRTKHYPGNAGPESGSLTLIVSQDQCTCASVSQRSLQSTVSGHVKSEIKDIEVEKLLESSTSQQVPINFI